jgi:signal transduction histidine kinase
MSVTLIGELYTATISVLGVVNFSLCVYLWTARRNSHRSITAGCITLAVAEVCLMFHLLTNTTSPEAGFVYARLRFLGLSVINPLLLIFFLQYTRRYEWLKPPLIAGLFVIPLLTQFVLWFTPSAQQFFGGWELLRIEGFSFEQRNLGGWYYVHAYYGGVLLFLSLALLAWYARQVDSSRRRDLYLLSVMGFIVTIGVSNFITFGPAPGFKSTPVALGIASIILIWVFLGGSAPRVMPVAYDVIFGSIHDAVIVIDPRGQIVKVNPAAERVFQRPAPAMLSHPMSLITAELQGWTDDHTGAPFEVKRDAGDKTRIYEAQYLPLAQRTTSLGRLIVLRDVTARHEAVSLHLERQRSQIINSFIADASHEFRTPLSVIKSSAYLLGRQAGGPTGARHVVQINEYADRINALVDDLQLIASLDAGEPVGREPIEVDKLIQSAVDGFGYPQTALKNQTLTVSNDSALPLLRGNNEELLTALQKILHNAVRYTPNGGAISLKAVSFEGGVRITVTDTGIGMDEKTAQAAPQRFYRLDTARTTAGFGLGLTIAQRIVERQGGTLTIDSAPGAGTAVTITLPPARL